MNPNPWQPEIDAETRSRAVDAAQGKAPFDLLLRGGQIVDVITGEIRYADVGIVGPMIASVHAAGTRSDAVAVHELEGRFLSPGIHRCSRAL